MTRHLIDLPDDDTLYLNGKGKFVAQKLNAHALPDGPVAMNAQKITGLTNGTSSGEAICIGSTRCRYIPLNTNESTNDIIINTNNGGNVDVRLKMTDGTLTVVTGGIASSTNNLSANGKLSPSGAVAVHVALVVYWGSTTYGSYAFVRSDDASNGVCRAYLGGGNAGQYTSISSIVRMDSSGEIRIFMSNATGTHNMYMQVLGYFVEV